MTGGLLTVALLMAVGPGVPASAEDPAPRIVYPASGALIEAEGTSVAVDFAGAADGDYSIYGYCSLFNGGHGAVVVETHTYAAADADSAYFSAPFSRPGSHCQVEVRDSSRTILHEIQFDVLVADGGLVSALDEYSPDQPRRLFVQVDFPTAGTYRLQVTDGDAVVWAEDLGPRSRSRDFTGWDGRDLDDRKVPEGDGYHLQLVRTDGTPAGQVLDEEALEIVRATERVTVADGRRETGVRADVRSLTLVNGPASQVSAHVELARGHVRRLQHLLVALDGDRGPAHRVQLTRRGSRWVARVRNAPACEVTHRRRGTTIVLEVSRSCLAPTLVEAVLFRARAVARAGSGNADAAPDNDTWTPYTRFEIVH